MIESLSLKYPISPCPYIPKPIPTRKYPVHLLSDEILHRQIDYVALNAELSDTEKKNRIIALKQELNCRGYNYDINK